MTAKSPRNRALAPSRPRDVARNDAPSPTPNQSLTLTDPDDGPPPASDYDLADYRWVPVRRRPRLDGWTEEKQRRFIETLADTGLVSVAAKEVGMSRASAYALRRAPHGKGFARGWDAARHHAGGLIEDIAFDRAIEGVEHEVYDRNGEVVGAKLVYDNRLVQFLLRHLKPERYGAQAAERAASVACAPPPALEESLRAMEPALPAPPEQLLAPDELADALELAEVADGTLPRFHAEQRPLKSDAQVAADAAAARMARGAAAFAKGKAGEKLTEEEFADECYYLDPVGNSARRRRSRE